jgi:phosphoserine phosphatase
LDDLHRQFRQSGRLRLSGHVLVAVAGAGEHLGPRDCEALREAAHSGAIVWLSEGRAAEVSFVGHVAAARAAFAGRAIDVNVVPAADRRKKLLIADMDSTIINCEVVDELADFAGVKDEVAAITHRAVNGEIEFAAAVRARVALLKGLPLDRLARVYAERIRLNPGARELVGTMRAHGALTMLVSGGFTYFTARVAADVGFEVNQGNILVDDGAALTGEAAEPILGREAKLVSLRRAVGERGIALADCVAVGDGANDLDMIRAAGLGVAYHAKPIVAAAATASVVHGDLTALLYLQGYRDDEIVRP